MSAALEPEHDETTFLSAVNQALHEDSPEAYYAPTPGIKVAMPSTAADMKGLLKAAIRDPAPVVVFEHKKLYRAARGDTRDVDVLDLGHARIACAGDDVTLVAYGA